MEEKNMKTIYILLTRSGTILSRIVHLVTADTYTHVSIAFSEDLQPLYSSSRKNGETLFPAGPCLEQFHKGYYKKHPFIPCALFELQVSDEAYEKAKEEAQRFILNADSYDFNILGLLFSHFRIPLRRRSHFFCSQLVGEILQRSGAVQLPSEPALMRPVDYMSIPGAVCLFKGRLFELVHQWVRRPGLKEKTIA